jgi:hypothetical protein
MMIRWVGAEVKGKERSRRACQLGEHHDQNLTRWMIFNACKKYISSES